MKLTNCEIFLIVVIIYALYIIFFGDNQTTEHFKGKGNGSKAKQQKKQQKKQNKQQKKQQQTQKKQQLHSSNISKKQANKAQLPELPIVWKNIINLIGTNVGEFNMLSFQCQSLMQSHLNSLMTKYKLTDATARTNFDKINSRSILDVTMGNDPKQINHGATVLNVNAIPYTYINSLRLLHLIDSEINSNKSGFHDSNKRSEASNFVRGMRLGQQSTLKSLKRDIGGK